MFDSLFEMMKSFNYDNIVILFELFLRKQKTLFLCCCHFLKDFLVNVVKKALSMD